MLSDIRDIEVKRQSSGSILVRSLHNLGFMQASKAGQQYLAKENRALYESLITHPDVAYVEPNLIMQAASIINPSDDLDWALLWGLNDATYDINVKTVWEQNITGEGVNVAVLDTGIRPNHPDLQKNVPFQAGYDFISEYNLFDGSLMSGDGNGRDDDPTDVGDFYTTNQCSRNGCRQDSRRSSWHVSHVAGTIAMVDNAVGGVGVAPNATIIPIRVLGKCGGLTTDIIDGMKWAAGIHIDGIPDNPKPAKIINMSLGGEGRCSFAYQQAIDEVLQKGATIVIAAGNSNDNVDWYSPGNCEGVITVAATGATGDRASYSNYGERIDIAAPGGDQRYNSTVSDTFFSEIAFCVVCSRYLHTM